MYYIYKITNKVNNKIYIGQTSRPKIRWNEHKRPKNWKNRPNNHLYRAIAKYGKDNFTFEIIASASTLELINYLEETLIADYNSIDRNIGYNIMLGGNNKKISEETKQRLSKSLKGRKHSKETKLKMSESHKGINTWIKGRKLTEEHKKSISDTMKKRMSQDRKKAISLSLKGNKSTFGQTWKVINGKRIYSKKVISG